MQHVRKPSVSVLSQLGPTPSITTHLHRQPPNAVIVVEWGLFDQSTLFFNRPIPPLFLALPAPVATPLDRLSKAACDPYIPMHRDSLFPARRCPTWGQSIVCLFCHSRIGYCGDWSGDSDIVVRQLICRCLGCLDDNSRSGCSLVTSTMQYGRRRQVQW